MAISAIGNRELKGEFNILKKDLVFTEREMEISKLLVDGLTSKEIADKLFLSQGTVKNYLSDIYAKIGTNDRAKAIIFLKK